MNKLFTQLLEIRHIDDDFLHPKYEDLTDPFEMPDMEKAVKRIEKAAKNNEKILIYGDYDVDGVTASALMDDTLFLSGIPRKNISIMLPDRFIDGYGMSPRLLTRAKDEKVSLVITVDCGSRNHEIVKQLKDLKIDTIITDHHECEKTLPDAVAVVNPKRKDYKGPEKLKDLAGVGVAFKLAQALVNKNIIPAGQEKWLLDFVLLGTVCDSMPLTRENRILGFYGIKVLEKTRRPGLKELIKKAKVDKITSEAISFQLGPRLNAAGRLDTAELSLELLRTRSFSRAAAVANELETLNFSRRTEQKSATAEIIARGNKPAPVIVESGNWHEGILGIVAGRLVEKYHKPAFVLSEVEDGVLKGSGRSFGDFSLADALNYAKDTIVGGGGHAGAAGVRVEKGKLKDFTIKINEFYHSLHLTDQERFLKLSPDLSTAELNHFNLDFLTDLTLLEPYGAGNREPIFELKNAYINGVRRMGTTGQHLRLDLMDSRGNCLKCIAFSAPNSWLNLTPNDHCDFLIQPTENIFRGVRSVEARLLAIHPAE